MSDARLISRQLGFVLTARRFSKQERMDMCGVPFRQLTTYVARLLAEGHKVAVADQLENPTRTRRLIKRDIVRVRGNGMRARSFYGVHTPTGRRALCHIHRHQGCLSPVPSSPSYVVLP